MITRQPVIDLIPQRAELIDAFRRPITYLRVSVTDRCNLRCVYCMPSEGLPWIPRSDMLSFDEIVRVIRVASSLGVSRVRLTGGEPLLRPDLARLVRDIANIPGIEDISLSTNGLRLADQAAALVAAGLQRVNISLDTLQADRFERLARRRGLDAVFAGLAEAERVGLTPIKLNCVVMRGENDDELQAFAALTKTLRIFVRFIELMPVHENLGIQRGAYMSSAEILERVRGLGELLPVAGPTGAGPARYFAYRDAPGAVGVISPLSHDYCERCNRVRLTADGQLRLCLFGDNEIDLRLPLRSSSSDEPIADIFAAAMLIKPERHHLEIGRAASELRALSQVGG